MAAVDLMKAVATIGPEASVADAAKLIGSDPSRAVVVVDNRRPLGIVTDHDIVAAVVAGEDPSATPVSSRMTTELVTIESTAESAKAHDLMRRHTIRHLPVVDAGRVVGMITRESAMSRAADDAASAAVANKIGRRPVRVGAGVVTHFRGPWADGPPAEALKVESPPLDKIAFRDLLRLVVVAWVFAISIGLSLAKWVVRRKGRTLFDAGCDGLVDAFFALGPTFVKTGQLITSSPGVFPEPLAEACKRCLDEVPPFSGELVRQVVEEDLGRPPAQLFKYFDDIPLASASIAQVHACVLPDGREAVIKMQRPGIRKSINSDLRIMYRLATFSERFEWGQRLSLIKAIEDNHKVSNQEINCALEAHRQMFFRDHIDAFGDNAGITAPEVYWEYCGPRMICMERMYGVPIDSFDVIREQGVDGELILRRGFKVAMEAMLLHGPFHGDVHAGNIWVLEDGRASYLDFGLMGELPDDWRKLLADLFKTTMIDNNWARVVRNYKNVGVLAEDVGDDEEVGMRLRMVLEPLMNTKAGGVNLGEIFKQQIQLAETMGAKAPQELMLVGKQVFYFERYIKGLAPDYIMARDLYLMKNIWPEEVKARAAELGVDLPD